MESRTDISRQYLNFSLSYLPNNWTVITVRAPFLMTSDCAHTSRKHRCTCSTYSRRGTGPTIIFPSPLCQPLSTTLDNHYFLQNVFLTCHLKSKQTKMLGLPSSRLVWMGGIIGGGGLLNEVSRLFNKLNPKHRNAGRNHTGTRK
jgi:hypothetical protein